MYVCMYVRTYVCMYVWMHVCMSNMLLIYTLDSEANCSELKVKFGYHSIQRSFLRSYPDLCNRKRVEYLYTYIINTFVTLADTHTHTHTHTGQ